jgi:hypothetical protein
MAAKEPAMAASQRLSHLLQLADQGPALRAALAEEVVELLLEWPADHPSSMRNVCEALLAKSARDLDVATCARLRERLAGYPDLAARLLPRESASRTLVDAARRGDTQAMAQSLGVDADAAGQLLKDEAALAAACKTAHIDRAAFSALIVLTRLDRDTRQAYAALDAFDTAA